MVKSAPFVFHKPLKHSLFRGLIVCIKVLRVGLWLIFQIFPTLEIEPFGLERVHI